MAEKLDIQKQYEVGFPIFEKLFNLPAAEFRVKLQEICGNKIHNQHLFTDSSNVRKTTLNDRPQEIVLEFYDSISVSPFGISYSPEHGEGKNLVEFDKFFVLS